MSLDCLGFEFSQGLGSIFEAAGGLTTGISSMVKQAQEEKKIAADEEKSVHDAIAADVAAASALAKASVSAQLKAPSAGMDQKAADVALTSQGQAAGKLSGNASELRAAAAEKSRAAAIAAAQAAPKDAYKAALVDAWTTVINKANNSTIVSKGSDGDAPRSGHGGGGDDKGVESFLTKKVVGPVPVWGAGLAALLGGLLAKKYLLR